MRLLAAPWVLLVLLLVACRPPLQSGLKPISPAFATQEVGALRITVRWPDRSVLVIPVTTRTIALQAFKEGQSEPLRTATLTRTTEPTASATLEALPTAVYSISGTARDSGGQVVASGIATVSLLPNQITPVHLTLASNDRPAIRSFNTVSAVRGQRVTVFGSGFGESSGVPVAVSVGSTTVPAGAIIRLTDGLLSFDVPADAVSGPIKIQVGNNLATSAADLLVITRLEASPSVAFTFQPHGQVAFKVRGFDAGGLEVPIGKLNWVITGNECVEAGEECLNVGVIAGDGIFNANGEEPGDEVGTLSIRVGSDLVHQDVRMATHAISRADLPGGMGPLVGPVVFPFDNVPTAKRSALGKKLFFEKGLSSSGQMSCATCHDPTKGFGDERAKGLGNDGADLPRNTPTVLEAAYFPTLFWDGRALNLEDQAFAVFEGPREFASNMAAMTAFVNGKYGAEFQEAYNSAPTVYLVAMAIATYERTDLISGGILGDSPFDKWAKGDDTALSQGAKRGLGLFLGKGGCIGCHTGPLFSDGKFHNVGIPGSGTTDKGRLKVTESEADRGAFKTPTLRNVSRTAPYFHDGSRATLADAVRHYENFDGEFPNLDAKMVRANISTDMIEFLNSLESPIATP